MAHAHSFEALLSSLVRALYRIHGDDLVFVVHFGSTARGFIKPETDVDLLVCLNRGLLTAQMRQDAAAQLEEEVKAELQDCSASGFELRLSPLYKSRAQMIKIVPLFFDIATDGKILFEHGKRAQEFFLDVKNEMLRKKVVRKRVGMKWYWVNV